MKFTEFFRRQVQVARVAGIPVRIDYRWFFIFALSAWVIASSFEQGTIKTQRVRLDAAAAWAAGIATTFGLFLSIFGHELSHALLARAEGIESEEIVLHPFGGFTRLRREPDTPRAEFRIAIAGPSASFLIGVVALVGFYAAASFHLRTLAAALSIIGFWNFVIAASNLLPGYPLDGGRVLRAYLWRRTGQLEDATRVASLGGQLIGGALVVFGGYFYLKFNDAFMGLWLALVGFFLFDAARAIVRRKGRRGRARTVADAMGAPVSIEPETLVSHFVDTVLLMHRQPAFAVARDGQLHGILTLEDLKRLPRERWPTTRVREVMRPVAPELFVQPQASLDGAMRLMTTNGAGALAVINQAGQLVGFLLRGQLKRRAKA